jgi:hypothetical protein
MGGMACRDRVLVGALVVVMGCGGDDDGPGVLGDHPIQPPAPSCESAGGGAAVATPVLVAGLSDGGEEGWLGSPSVVDLDGDGEKEIVAARDSGVVAWAAGGEVLWSNQVDGRTWASVVVADIDPDSDGLEVAAASRGQIYLWSAAGEEIDGFPATWSDEMRSLATGDVDGDGQLELVAVTTSPVESGGQRDIVIAVEASGEAVAGFPPNTAGDSGCDDACYVTGGYDQNVALGDVDGDGISDIFVGQDNAYLSLHDGTGRAFDCNPFFEDRTKFMGVRAMLDYAEAKQGYSEDEATSNQGHFTNSAPAIADLDGDGVGELVILGSVQNASQDDRERGVALWVMENDGSRPPAWEAPYHAPDFIAGLWDFDGTNVVAATNQVSVVELDPDRAGPEILFAGFDGRIHAVSAANQPMWTHSYTGSDRVLTTGVAVADLSQDGVPEIVFATYSPDDGRSQLVILDGGGNPAAAVDLPGRGAMSVPTIADVDGDGDLEIVVALKDASSDGEVLVYDVPGSGAACLLWPTGRGNDRRDGYLPPGE